MGDFFDWALLFIAMKQKRKRIRKKKDGTFSPRQVLEKGHWRLLSFEEKVFVTLTWCGFTNAEAFGVINPLSEASANSRAVMAGRYACNPNIKTYIELLNQHMDDCNLFFKGQQFKIGEHKAEDAVAEYRFIHDC